MASSQDEAVGYSSGQECVLNEGIALRTDEISVSTLDADVEAGLQIRRGPLSHPSEARSMERAITIVVH